MRTARIEVRHPLQEGRILLRAEEEWTVDREPVAEDRAAGRFEFEIEVDGEFAYYKPVLQLPTGEVRWSVGENFLALPGVTGPVCFPHFHADSRCSVCDVHEVGSESSGQRHAVRVFSPPGYDENVLERYPVLYMQDGQNLFFPDEAFGGRHWKVEETLGLLGAMNLLRKVLVVGVYPGDRMKNYTRPGYEEYGRFMVRELVPWVDEHYRTLKGPEHTAVLGSSLGGVVSFYLGWEYPQVFGHVGAMSSTFGYRDDLLRRVATEPKRPLEIYLDTGWPRDNYEVNRRLRHLLVERGWQEGRDLTYLAFPEAGHNESAWATRVHIPFQRFFGVEHRHETNGASGGNGGPVAGNGRVARARRRTAGAKRRAVGGSSAH